MKTIVCTAVALGALCTAAGAAPINVSGKPTAAEWAAVRRADPAPFRDVEKTEGHKMELAVAKADVNGDGRPDLIAQYADMSYCGSAGCSSVIVMATPKGYAAKSIGLPNFHGTVNVLSTKHHGMKDLRFDDATYVFKWNGRMYR